ncbi:MAG: acetobutylicum phosphotransbutyrylase [uncultured bacterium]|uniref:VanZ-like domain-containing protein n=1 Tax=candidate division WWE3 bacterium RBG_16_37_10 TaxID=1802610 RepID=A0A1F4UTM4_UNCKA|nr:MAG: acetobutylicum phosphotransbutyrylase [uncultured bacterium]OGC48305.1 MAG: hypothetical protein A2W32_03770 [candidate division WWE3 bacterium RBG_16_37_10]
MRIVVRWIPAVLVGLFIFWLSSQTGLQLKQVGLDKDEIHILGHFWMFFVLSICLYRASKNPFVAVLLSFIYAVSDEYHQTFIFGRSASLKDLVNDTLAASFAAILIWKLYPKLPKILKSWLSV